MATTGDSDCAVESIPSPPPHIETTAQLFDRGRPSIEINDSINPTDSDLQSRCLSSRDDNIMFLVKKATSRLDKWTDDFLAKVEQSIGESYDSEGDISWAVYSPPLFFAEEDVDLEIEKLMSAYGKEGEHSKSSDAQKEDDNEKNKNVSAIAPKDVSTYQSALPFRKFEDFFDVSTVFPSKVAYPHCWMDCLDIVTLYCPEENDLLQLLNLKNVSNDYYPRSGGKVYSLSDFIDPFLLAEITQSFHPQNHESDGDYFNDLVAQLVRRMLESSSHALYDVVLQLWTIEGNFNSSNMVDEVDDSNAFTMSGLEQLQHSNRNSLLPSRRYDRQFSLGGLDLHEDAFDDNKKRRSIEHFVSPTVANEVENFSVDEESDEGIMGIGNVAFEDSLIQGSGHLSVKDRVFSAVKMLIVCVELRQDQKDTLLKLLIFCGEYLLVIDRLINWNMDDLLFAYAVRMAASANTLAGLRYQPIDRNSDAKLTDERDPASDGGKQEEKHYKQHSYNQLYHRHGRGAAFVDVDYAADIPVDLTRCTMIEACAEVDVEKYFGESIATRRMEEAIPVFHHTVKHFLQKGSWSFVVEMLLVRPYDYPYYLLLELFARLPSLPAYEAELMRRAYFCY